MTETAASHRTVRVIALGDDLLAGAGDSRTLGWIGRAIARSTQETPIDLYACAVPGADSAAIAERWEEDVRARYDRDGQASGTIDHRVVIGIGPGDLDAGISLARARLNLAKVVDGLERWRLPVFVVGPPPATDRSRSAALRDLSQAYRDVCSRRRVPYVDTLDPLLTHDQWLGDLADSPTGMPGQAGYGLLAWLVLHGGFEDWVTAST